MDTAKKRKGHGKITSNRQVVIGLCKRKETAALKIKAAVSNGRVNLSTLRRLFFFCRRPAEWLSHYF